MTIAERNNKLKHFITCLKCEVSGKPCDDNCSTQYEVGNMGEIIENLEAISKVLEQETILDKIRADIGCLKHKNTDYSGYRWWNNAIDNCLCEIDKYKTESEGTK